MVSLTHKSAHVANEAEEAALWGVCATLAEGWGGTMRQAYQGPSTPLPTPFPHGLYLCLVSSRQAPDLKSSYVMYER